MDPEDDPLTYSWTLVGPSGALTLTGANTDAPSFIPNEAGQYTATLVVNDGFGDSVSSKGIISIINPGDFAEERISLAIDIVATLPSSGVTTQGNQQAFINFLNQAIAAIQVGDIAKTIDKLEKALIRTDGCVLNDPPMADGPGPSKDWITDNPDCTTQETIYQLLDAALNAISP